MNILIVDDDPVVRQLLPRFCKIFSRDCIPLTAGNGEEALTVLASEHVDLILTDVEMPVMDGCELVARVKTQYPNIKIIVMSGLSCDEAGRRLRNAGIPWFIEKPFSASELASSIESVIRNGYGNSIPGGA